MAFCVLRNQNPYSTNCFHGNFDVLVNSSFSDEDEDARRIDLTDLWVHKPQYLTKTHRNDEDSRNWDKPEVLQFRSEISPETPNSGGVSSLLRRWREGKTDNSAGDEPPSPPSPGSDASEKERLKVADIIRKLTCNVGEENHSESALSPSPRVRTPADQPAARCYSPGRIIRGRQAFVELLVRMEQERLREIEGVMEFKSVSKFQHKGRIQAMLRLKFLRREMNVSLNSKSSGLNRVKESSIMHLRDRFNAITIPKDSGEVTTSDNHINREVDSTLIVGNASTSCCQGKEGEQSEEIKSVVYEEVAGQRVSCEEVNDNESVKLSGTERPHSNSEETIDRRPVETSGRDEEAIDHQPMESEWDWISERSRRQSGSCDFEEYLDVNQDWITDVSRPRSEWEDLRQARYQEMLDPFSDKKRDIQELLQRRSVSSFLSGNMREKIDQLMISRSHQRTVNVNVQEAKEHQDEEQEENQEEGNDAAPADEFDSQIQKQINANADLVDQNWSYNQDCDSSYDSDHTVSAYLPQQQFSNFYSPNNQPYRSSQRHPSIETQLVYELKAQLEKLHQEIFEVKRSVKTCMNMQMKLQRSIKHEVSAVLSQSGKKRGRGSGKKCPRKGNCCICHDRKVDSLLYRCGHICTCYNCAWQLQLGEGRCPICQAPILDIVRTQVN